MKRIVYWALTDLILSEGKNTVDEVLKKGRNLYGFEIGKGRADILVAIALADEDIEEIEEGIFKKVNRKSVYGEQLTEYLKKSGLLMDMGVKRFYLDFQNRFASNSPE